MALTAPNQKRFLIAARLFIEYHLLLSSRIALMFLHSRE